MVTLGLLFILAANPTDNATDKDEPRYKGIGLTASAGVVGAAGLGVTIARSALLKKNCPLEGMNAQCTYDFGSDIGLAATQWSLNFATVGLSTGAGVMLGRGHAWKDAGTGKKRNVKAIKAGGGALLGVGLAGITTSIALAFVLPSRCLQKEVESGDPLSGDRCLLKSFPAWTLTNWASFAMVSSGSGMLAYGSQYGKRRPGLSSLRLSPNAGPTYAGVGLSGRF